ncbi:hypothetical protein K492DRAFT_178492 [Lichtheimia hyalospora FSU 10163]|nr:hypothetical protein K492DRAFT_178492 [Lichtheimia hyalospora FSU 10163]
MKDVGFKTIDIIPADTVLEFIGQVQKTKRTEDGGIGEERMDGSIALRGQVVFTLGRPVKIRGMSVKFKGTVSTNASGIALQTPLLPKLKQALFGGKTTLPAGEHVVPFLLEIPNIYPASIALKRASIEYRVEVSVAIGLQKKSITASHPIELRRHLLRCKEMAPLVETQILEDTIPAKFHYAIDAPQIVCREQGVIPVAVKYLCFASQKPVRTIRTQIRQIELHSSSASSGTRNRIIPGSNGRPHRRYVKRTVPALLHTVTQAQEKSTWKHPLVLRHELQPLLTPTLHAPLVSIYHELEITFQFEHQFEDIKARIPIVVASVPSTKDNINTNAFLFQLAGSRMPQYHFEMDQARLHDSCISVVVEKPARVREVNPVYDAESLQPDIHCRSLLGEPRLPVTSSSINLLQHSTADDDDDYYNQQHSNSNNSMNGKDSIGRSIRKFASANELCSILHDDDDDDDEHNDDNHLRFPLERPRTTTPIAQRRKGGMQMPSIDVDLANGLKRHGKQQQHNNMATVDRNLMMSKARLQQAQRQSKQRTANASIPPPPSKISTMFDTAPMLSQDDAVSSIGSDSTSQSSRRPHSINSSSSADDSPIDEHLRSRPPSIVYATAPGLPAETELRPQEAYKMSLVEESFVPSCDLSPLATIASSTLLSPRTSLALRKSKASSHAIPLSTAIGARDSSVLDKDGEILRRIACTQQRLPSQPPPPKSPLPPVPPLPESAIIKAKEAANALSNTNASIILPPAPPPPPSQHPLPPPPSSSSSASAASSEKTNPYVYLELPPLPQETSKKQPSIDTTTRRMTKLYVEDSDDEVLDPLPPIPERHLAQSSLPSSSSSSSCSSSVDHIPILPRLSLGTEFDISFE